MSNTVTDAQNYWRWCWDCGARESDCAKERAGALCCSNCRHRVLVTPPDADITRAARALHHHGACTCEGLTGCRDDVHVVLAALRDDAPTCGGCPACDGKESDDE